MNNIDKPYQSPLLGVSLRMPPNNIQAEQALLGAILANNRAFGLVAGFLKPQHFADPIHARIYEQCARGISRDQLVDAVTLKVTFEHAGILDEVGGTPYLAQLLTAMVGIMNAGEYGRAIYDAWLRRELIDIGQTVADTAHGADPDLDGEAILQLAADQLMDLSSSASRDAPAVSIGDAARDGVDRQEARQRPGGARGLSTGLHIIDQAIGDLEGSQLYLLGGRSGMGKSTLAIQTAIAAARQLAAEEAAAPPFSGAGGQVLFFTLEMPPWQVGWWATCHIAKLDNQTLRERSLTYDEAMLVKAAQAELDRLPLKLIDGRGMTGAGIALRTRAESQKRRVRLMIGDHLSKLQSDQALEKQGQTVSMSKTTSGQKNLAKQLDIPVLWLAQIGREVDKRDDPRPRLSDLMYAGEADADVAFFLFREERYLKKRPPEKYPGKESEEQYDKRRAAWRKKWDDCEGRAELIVAKRREGPETLIMLGFSGPTTSFYALGADADLIDDQGAYDAI